MSRVDQRDAVDSRQAAGGRSGGIHGATHGLRCSVSRCGVKAEAAQ
jgi:hypothetical protein